MYKQNNLNKYINYLYFLCLNIVKLFKETKELFFYFFCNQIIIYLALHYIND